MDKVSDYEDIWGPEGNNCSTFKPNRNEAESTMNNGLMKSKRPDLLPDTLRKYYKYKFYLIEIIICSNIIFDANNVMLQQNCVLLKVHIQFWTRKIYI